MALKTLTLLLAATGIGVALYRMGQQRSATQDSSADDGDTLAAEPSPLLSASKPNFGEQLQDMQLANAGMGAAGNSPNEDLLSPPRADEQQTEEIRPGLPDFARGA
ncbi:hypothetical protein [Piscinibacter sp. HJYY11]|uniref:hypothetical protein n=1 Tax=Piscinibacter sp. HJYY11 TaxID=2801333 RepID=UPI00191CD607|nr:hypothetical protein [Piscinibacter sp. HJYY11]MBL0727199.1 hypothetical protein [Piscinibacter sp. HJYY11]